VIDLNALYAAIPRVLPVECLEARFMQQALVGLMLLAPMTAVMGTQVVNLRMAFFADAVSHSVFAGIALGLLLAVDPHGSMAVFGVAVGISIMAVQRRSRLSADTVIGVFFSLVIAFGLAVVSRERQVARDLQRFLYGDILTIGDAEICGLALLALVIGLFQALGFNRMLYIGFSPLLAQAHRVRVGLYQYGFAGLLALVVIVAVWAVGVLLVTALLIIPAAAAHNLARSAGGVFWWALGISFSSAVAGLVLSAQPWAGTATGATVILVTGGWFLASLVITALRGAPRRL
jgi:zinc transport system permease protein